MSDTEFFFEENLNSDRELIATIRVHRYLYDKMEKLYANGDIKTATWEQIGASLTHPIEGRAAEKRFYALRQRFGKERRKIIQSMPRSGAGADQLIYKPSWPLYKDLIFLEDVIKPRKTSSNYKSKVVNSEASICHTSIPSPFTSALSDSDVTVQRISPFSSKSAAASSDMSSWNSDSLPILADTDESCSDICETSFVPLPTTLYPSTSPPLDSGNNNAVVQGQKTMSKISIKRKVPTPDVFANKKRQEVDAVNKSLIEQSKGLTDLAAKIGQAIMVPPAPPSVPSAVVSNAFPDTKPMLSAIGFALGIVPEYAQLECLIGILQYINDFTMNKKKRSD